MDKEEYASLHIQKKEFINKLTRDRSMVKTYLFWCIKQNDIKKMFHRKRFVLYENDARLHTQREKIL